MSADVEPTPRSSLIFGIDPGLVATGWAAIEPKTRAIVDSGVVKTEPEFSFADRVEQIGFELMTHMVTHNPCLVAVESFVYFPGQRMSWPAMQGLRVIERALCTAEMYGFAAYELPTVAAKTALGLRGKVSKARVKAVVSAFFSGEATNEHTRDAVVVAWAGWLKMKKALGTSRRVQGRVDDGNGGVST